MVIFIMIKMMALDCKNVIKRYNIDSNSDQVENIMWVNDCLILSHTLSCIRKYINHFSEKSSVDYLSKKNVIFFKSSVDCVYIYINYVYIFLIWFFRNIVGFL